jgi:serine/threonine protein kinase
MLEDFVEVYSVRDLLGVGAYGVVLQVKNKITNEHSALKIIPKDKLSNAALSILKNESSIMSHMSHPSVVAFKRIFENPKFIILEMELVIGGQLKRLFKKMDQSSNPTPLSDLEASRVVKSLLEGVAYIHDRSIIHRDIKPENILLTDLSDACSDVKIVDFGLSAEFNLRLGKDAKEKAGTLIYMAPEQITLNNYSKKVDVWPCGIIMF